MTWAVTPDVERFDEASDWFQKRTVITAPTAAEMTGRIAQDSFWVGAGLQLTQVQRVFDKMATAIEKGETFADWRAKVRGELRNDAHAETVFRNATQRAYNAGRWYQMLEPDVVRFRPYWMFDAILDGRTTLICQVCGNTILPADNPWWATHVPPLHHKCRSSIRNLRKAEAERRGIAQKAPDTNDARPPGDWGKPPTAPGWKPDLKKVDPVLAASAAKKQELNAVRQLPSDAPSIKDPHSYEEWVKHYKPTYGEAAKSVAWGRSAMEFGLDMPMSKIRMTLRRLSGSSIETNMNDLLARFERNGVKTLREAAGSPDAKILASMVGHMARIERRAKPIVIKRGTDPSATTNDIEFRDRVVSSISALSGKQLRHPTFFRMEFSGERSYADSQRGRFLMPKWDNANAEQTFAHEWFHAIEHRATGENNSILDRAIAFREARAASPKLHKLNKLIHNGYGDEEVGFDGKYLHKYMGKKYDDDDDTEVTSMAVEYWISNVHRFSGMLHDPETMWFGLGQMSGHNLKHAPNKTRLA